MHRSYENNRKTAHDTHSKNNILQGQQEIDDLFHQPFLEDLMLHGN